MRKSVFGLFTCVLFSSTGIPVHAQDLLGGLLGGDGLGSILNVDSGPASNEGLVNVGIGGGGGNVLDLNIGGSSAPVAGVSVNNGGDGGLGVGANLLDDTATVGVDVGGGGGNLVNARVGVGGGNLVDLDVGIGLGGGGAGTPGLPGAPGTPGAPGMPGTPGVNGGNGFNGNNGAGFAAGNSGSNGRGVACEGMPVNQVITLLRSTRFSSSWSRASGVKVQPIGVCSDVKAWLTSQLNDSNLGASLRQAVQSDALINASLSRTKFGAERVLAVKQNGSQLIVYVY